jgi:TolA-binding protein
MGCHAMDAVTHPDERVRVEVAEHFVPVKLESARHGEVSRHMNVRWLPGLVIADAAERPAHVSIGFLPPPDLLTELTFGRGIVAMGEKRYDEAHALLSSVAATPDAERAPEALFWWGVSRYRQSKDFRAAVEEPWTKIVEGWPRSQWARKVAWMVGRPGESRGQG